jgi:hypothetical protein
VTAPARETLPDCERFVRYVVARYSSMNITWQGVQTYTHGTSRKVDVNRSGRFMALRISTTGDVWRMRSFDVDAQPQGLW